MIVVFFLIFLFSGEYIVASSSTLLHKSQCVLDSVDYKLYPSVITEHEWNELQLDRLIATLDRTQTSFGRWGLVKLLHPITNVNEIVRRQKIISFLIENEGVLQDLRKQLSIIHKYEKSLLSYWDDCDQLDKACSHFYCQIPILKKYINKSNIVLDVNFVVKMVDSCRGLLVSLCLAGVYQEFMEWLMSEKASMSIKQGIIRGFEQPVKQHSFSLDVLNDCNKASFSFKDYMRAMVQGSFGDRYYVLLNGYNFNATDIGLPAHYSYCVDNTASGGLIAKLAAFVCAGTGTVAYDYIWGMNFINVIQNMKHMYCSLNQLNARVLGVQRCLHVINNIKNYGEQYAQLFDVCSMANACDTVFFDIFTFGKYGTSSNKHFYSRGKILHMHHDIKNAKSDLVPCLQFVAFIDAYCSIAQLYKEGQSQKLGFCFASFVDSNEPFIYYKNAWLALLPTYQAVGNDLLLGGSNQSKIIITGPNGGGKSTILKACGVAAVLAQSWGIVPASLCEQTLFTTIKTALASHEQLEKGLSTFMAEKKCMEEMYDCIKKSDANNHVLALIDEPYKGTVDDESAKRIYNFGKNIACYPSSLMYLATHVKKPIFLASEMPDIFANYHVAIQEEFEGVFERLFLLEQGPANWWFDDEEKRGRFIDWIGTQIIE